MHKSAPFFGELVKFMTAGPCIVQVLEGENAIAKQPRAHGRDRPGEGRSRHHPQEVRRQHRAQRRARLGRPETAKYEIGFFFSGAELARLGVTLG